ncbi:MAG: hypothetical protein D6756_05635 [Cyanobacteria bacterium J083]|nr:MAG: hypothetical protein D6756_05635 [Cyanobacteria bacterium J083]
MDELRIALELATEEELNHLSQILFTRRFNPLDYLQKIPQPQEIANQAWQDKLDTLDRRFRYLAADGLTVLQGKTEKITYRQILIQVCRYLKIPYSTQMPTTDIEAEIFLHLMGKAWKKLPRQEQKSLQANIMRSLSRSRTPEPLPVHLQHNPLDVILKGSGIVAINSLVKSWLLKHIARQFALHFTSYQMAKTAIVKSGTVVAAQISNKLVLKAASRGMAVNAARYGAVKTAFAFLGPVLWASFLADLGWKAIATNYGRIIPTIVTLAQIRLTRGEEGYCLASC